ncbi:sulfatase [candidate division CSSED10-310 bacterium]|uniref:Sulfatase n=1 Tax=candidate division CSSED10-310 bacterium TaxID=2855610 RepID=A0ABV6YZI0_UNCC1
MRNTLRIILILLISLVHFTCQRSLDREKDQSQPEKSQNQIVPREKKVIYDLLTLVQDEEIRQKKQCSLFTEPGINGQLPSLESVVVANQFQRVIAFAPGSLLEIRNLHLQKPRLSFRLGWRIFTSSLDQEIRFTIDTLSSQKKPIQLFSRTIDMKKNSEGWSEFNLDLPGDVRNNIRFSVSTITGTAPLSFFYLNLPRIIDVQPYEPPSRSIKYKNVILITLDTTRRDYVGFYQNMLQRRSIPYSVRTLALNRLAKESYVFMNATTPISSTGPAHISMLTGLYPHSVNVHQNGVPLAEHFTTLGEVLLEHGYETAAFISGSSLKSYLSGLQQGFVRYDDQFEGRSRRYEQKAPVTTPKAVEWLKTAPTPYFLWVHYFDPHFRYSPPIPFNQIYDPHYQGSFDELLTRNWKTKSRIFENKIGLSQRDVDHAKALYAGEISYMDSYINELLTIVKSAAHWDNTLILVAADHGEYLGELSNFFHHNGIREELLRIPLFLKLSSSKAGIIREPISLIDLTPTILELLGIATPNRHWDGRSFAGLLQSGNHKIKTRQNFEKRYLYAEFLQQHSIRRNSWKYTIVLHDKALSLLELLKNKSYDELLFNLEQDPDELRNIAHDETYSETKNMMSEILHQKLLDSTDIKHEPRGRPDIDDTTRKSLQALGYLQ